MVATSTTQRPLLVPTYVEPSFPRRDVVDGVCGQSVGFAEPLPTMAVPEIKPFEGADRDDRRALVQGDCEGADVLRAGVPDAGIGERRPAAAVGRLLPRLLGPQLGAVGRDPKRGVGNAAQALRFVGRSVRSSPKA